MSKPKKMDFSTFCKRLKYDGAYVGEDGHVYRSNGKPLSRLCRNGYFLLRKMYDGIQYHHMEHRVIWFFAHGRIDDDMVINHKDFDRGNNRIENLELISQKENIAYTTKHGRSNYLKGADSPNAHLTEREVQAIRHLAKGGWERKELAVLFNAKNPNLISRVVTGARYGTVQDASSIWAIYPVIVMKTANQGNRREILSNIALGMCGESGELSDIIKKHLYHDHDLDVDALILELGDILYYITWLCTEIGIEFADVLFANMDKLDKRYPNGFDTNRSIHRPEYGEPIA